MEKDPWGVGVVYLTVLCDHPYLDSAVQLVTLLMLFITCYICALPALPGGVHSLQKWLLLADLSQ